jgi:hypothetical protein
VRPGDGERFKLHVYTPRWKLAHNLSSMLALSSQLKMEKDTAKNAPALVRSFLGLQAGDASSAGMDKSGTKAADRAGNVPEVTRGVTLGESGATRFTKENDEKIRKLIAHWRDVSKWEHDYIWVPVELLP